MIDAINVKCGEETFIRQNVSGLSRHVVRGVIFSLILSLISFGLKRGENGGVRFQVICRSKVKKFKKVDGDDFFPIVCCLNNCKQK